MQHSHSVDNRGPFDSRNHSATKRAYFARMTSPDPTPLNDALQRLRNASGASLLLCGLAIGAIAWTRESEVVFDAGRSRYIAMGLAAVAILARRRPELARRGLRPFLYASVGSLMACVGLGLLGIVVALQGQTTVGGLYTLAGAILLLRPMPRFAGPPPDEESPP